MHCIASRQREWASVIVFAAIHGIVDTQAVVGDGDLVAVKQKTDFTARTERGYHHHCSHHSDSGRQGDGQEPNNPVERAARRGESLTACADSVGCGGHDMRMLPCGLLVAEDVAVCPAGNIQSGACGQEIIAGLRHLHPPFTLQPLHQYGVQPMKETYVRRGIFALRIA